MGAPMPGGRALTRVSIVIENLFRPWRRASTWWGLAYALLGFLVATVTFSIVFTLLVTTVSLLIVFPLAIPVAWLMFVTSAGLGRLERSRARALLGLELPDPHAPLPDGSWWAKLKARAKSASRW